MKQGDGVVLVLVVLALAGWGWIRLKRWLKAPPEVRLPIPLQSTRRPRGPAVDLLEDSGYEVITGKHRIPLSIWVDEEPMSSRLFVDYFCRQGEKLYIAKVARERQPIPWTGSGIRERFLPYLLLFEEVSGLLYVDVKNQTVREIAIRLSMEDMDA